MFPVTNKTFSAVASVSSKEMTNDIQEPQSEVEIKHRPSRSDNNNPQVDNYPVKPSSVSEDNVKPTGKNFITGAKHTEVFQIRVKRNYEDKKQLNGVPTIEEPTVCRRRTKPSAWDALDIMKHVRYSFLGDMFGARKFRLDIVVEKYAYSNSL